MALLLILLGSAAAQDLSAWKARVDSINNDPTSTWRAVMPDERTFARLHDFLLSDFTSLKTLPKMQKPFPTRAQALPTDFDSRTKWPACPSIQRVRDQCGCGSCFAFGAVEAFEDRICIHSNKNVTLSVGDLIACHMDENFSCQGGNPITVWENVFHGRKIGDGAIQDSCYPYQPKPCPCNHHNVNSSLPHCPPESDNKDPVCDFTQKGTCAAQGTFHSTDPTLIPTFNMEEEIATNGPITAAFNVWDDFLMYKSGVYIKSDTAKQLGGHSIKILGYGVENGVKYWTVANSWNAEWGDHGFFKIRRGTDECFIESLAVVAGLPVKR